MRFACNSAGKIKALKALLKALSRVRRSGKRIVFTNGCFDILHAGHVTYLEKAKMLGDILVVGLNSDLSVRRIKGKSRPVNDERGRARVLASVGAVDYVTVFGGATPAKLIASVRPDVLVKGGDWRTTDIVGSAFVRSRGGRVATIPFVKGYSTTAILKRTSLM